ncbi:MAG: hypothetical protein BWY68_00693 [bacterium ADurb.Bin400]|nr:MAG: hypothetical protein BWY68_00693 [bacterium ADurb.Bin400]
MRDMRLKFITSLILTVIIAGLAVYLTIRVWRDDQAEQSSVSQQIPDPVRPAPEGWHTYVDGTYKFSISFPKGWRINTKTAEGIVVIANYESDPTETRSLRPEETKRIIGFVENPDKLSARDLQQRLLRSGDRIITEKTVLTGSGEQATKIQTGGRFGTTWYVYIPTSDPKRLIVITVISSDEKLDEMIAAFFFTG